MHSRRWVLQQFNSRYCTYIACGARWNGTSTLWVTYFFSYYFFHQPAPSVQSTRTKLQLYSTWHASYTRFHKRIASVGRTLFIGSLSAMWILDSIQYPKHLSTYRGFHTTIVQYSGLLRLNTGVWIPCLFLGKWVRHTSLAFTKLWSFNMFFKILQQWILRSTDKQNLGFWKRWAKAYPIFHFLITVFCNVFAAPAPRQSPDTHHLGPHRIIPWLRNLYNFCAVHAIPIQHSNCVPRTCDKPSSILSITTLFCQQRPHQSGIVAKISGHFLLSQCSGTLLPGNSLATLPRSCDIFRHHLNI